MEGGRQGGKEGKPYLALSDCTWCRANRITSLSGVATRARDTASFSVSRYWACGGEETERGEAEMRRRREGECWKRQESVIPSKEKL